MAGKKRYKLIVGQNLKEKTILIPVDDAENRKIGSNTNSFLSKIDLYTMNFEDKNEFIKAHKDDLKMVGINSNNKVDIKISYNQNGKKYFLEPAFKDLIYLKHYAEKAETNIEYDRVKSFISAFMSKMTGGIFFRYLLDQKLIDQTLENYIRRYVDDNESYFEGRVVEQLQRYKVVRRILMGLEEYQKQTGLMIFNYDEVRNFYKEKEEKQLSLTDLGMIDVDNDGGFVKKLVRN